MTKLTKELKPIPGFSDYSVDKDGNVWSKKFKREGGYYQLRSGFDKRGYRTVVLQKDSKPYTRKVHHLILNVFVGERPSGTICRHLNGVRHDNRLENLAWGTYKENIQDAVRHGTIACGERSGMAKLNEKQVRVIRWCRKLGMTQAKLGEYFGVSAIAILKIDHGKTWKHI